MSEWPDAPAIRAFLRRATRRLRWLAAARGAAIGLFVGLLALLIGGPRATTPLAMSAIAGAGALLGAAAGVFVLHRGRPVPARVEERTPQSRNVVLTAAELIDRPERVRPYIGRAVCRDAARVLSDIRLDRLFPAGSVLLAMTGSTAAWTLVMVLALTGSSPQLLPALAPFAAGAPAITDVEVMVTPPSYTGQQRHRLRDPQRITALAGSRIEVMVRGRADVVMLETVNGARTMTTNGAGRFSANVVADADGFLAFTPRDSARAGVPRLIGLTVTPDEAPRVRITSPAKDLLLSDGARTVDLALDATDDLGLASLRLTYTRVSGFGEQFTFTEGDVPLQLARTDERRWAATARWSLQPLGLQAGDMLVYRARASDRRPGAPAAESETYMIEVVVPNAVVSGGLAMDDEFDRYALSQQMIILLTERLLARRATLAAAEFAAEALTLAASQRRVRAEFVFMLGGELEAETADVVELDEEAHVRADADVAEGRLANLGRIELTRAVQSMSTAAAALSRVEMEAALTAERQALLHVQRAFARTRYILRALNQRERIDLSRRLSGVLAGAGPDARPSAEPVVDPKLVPLRRALADIAGLTGQAASDSTAAAAAALSQRILRIDPSDEAIRKVADAVTAAADALARGSTADAHARLNDALASATALVRAGLPRAPAQRSFSAMQLEGALGDALRSASYR